jgi:putative nucleotidyltransferase with HDIG domain
LAAILIVDDEDVVREVLHAQLASFGHRADLAPSAETALGLVESRDYDLIVCDLGMPPSQEPRLRRARPDLKHEEVGLEFLRTIAPQVHRRTPFMILTAWADLPFAVEAIRVGACNFLVKPWEIEDLRRAVERALEIRDGYRLRAEYQRELEVRLARARDELLQTYDGILAGLAAVLEGKDLETREHCRRVSSMCVQLARELGIAEDRMFDVRIGALLHDIGKCRVPDAILLKPSGLDAAEWEVMRRHPEFGADIVSLIPFLEGAREIILNHHEKYDGSGYPAGKRGEEIPLAARAFSVVDAYDAMRSKRCYKEAWSEDYAIGEIRRCSGTQFDPVVVVAFERILPRLREEPEMPRSPNLVDLPTSPDPSPRAPAPRA